jgi:5'-nucleotidase
LGKPEKIAKERAEMKKKRMATAVYGTILLVLWLAGPAAAGFPAGTRLKILVSNDDGIDAPGIVALVDKLSRIGAVTVAAPPLNSSGASHSMTFYDPIYVTESVRNGVKWYSVRATPATCVRLALENLLQEKPDLVVSGINRGDNVGVVTFYSATVASAREAAINGIPAIAANLLRGKDMDYDSAAEFIAKLAAEVAAKPPKHGIFLNVNIPNVSKEKIRGVLVVPQDTRPAIEFYERGTNPRGDVYYWNYYKELDAGTEKTDIWAIRNGYISITPLSIDQTSPDPEDIKALQSLKVISRGK